jgi:WD40 repeat protein
MMARRSSWDPRIAQCVWDAEFGQKVLPIFKGHPDYVWSVAFSHDDRRIILESHTFQWITPVVHWPAEVTIAHLM